MSTARTSGFTSELDPQMSAEAKATIERWMKNTSDALKRWSDTAAANLKRGLISVSDSLKTIGIDLGDPRALPTDDIVRIGGATLGIAILAYGVANIDRITMHTDRAMRSAWSRLKDLFSR